MIVPDRDLANTLFPFTIDIPNNSRILSTTVLMDIEINTPKCMSTLNSSNSTRESFIHSNMLFMVYADSIQMLANSLVWTDQVENKRFQSLFLFYVTVKKGKNSFTNLVLIVRSTV